MLFQCKLSKPATGQIIVAWIDERGAKVGASVEMKTADGEFWTVDEVYRPGMEESALRAKQAG